ncbi:MAG: putative aminohydrolase SsnA [Candidatus Eisenbacteria bacterium]
MDDRDLLIGPGMVFSGGRVVAGAGVLVRGGRIAAIGPHARLEESLQAGAARLDAGGGLVLPGLINAHTHLYSALARGFPLTGPPPADFTGILSRLWWRLDRALTLEDVRVSALLGSMEAVRCGVTTIVDHHASPGACGDSLAAIRAAVETVGIRAGLCYEVSDRDGPAAARAGIEENLRFARELRQAPSPAVAAQFGIHALFTVGEETLARCVDAARGAGLSLHLHLAEDEVDVRWNLEHFDERPVQRLARHRGLETEALLAHGTHVDSEEIEILAATKAFVAHNPESNMNNAVGRAPVRAMGERGVSVGLGTDGMSADMLSAARAAFLLARHAERDPGAAWRDVPRMLWTNNARLAARLFGLPVGELSEGAAADVIVLDYDPPTPLDEGNLFAHLVFGLSSRHVATTVAGGRVLMHERKLLTVDAAELQACGRERARALWKRIEALGS